MTPHLDSPITTAERAHLIRTIELAEQGRFSARPNPVVGAVLATPTQVLGEGFHEAYGELHAERAVLSQLRGSIPADATLYCSLEPCSHHGRQPPCVDAILESGVRRVVFAADDTDTITAGVGPQVLLDAGVEVVRGPADIAALAMRQNAGFHSVNLRKRPFVTYKFATTRDGFLATGDATDPWISSDASRAQVQVLRAAAGAVLVGIETVLADDPLLNVRDPELRALVRSHPLRVVVDRSLRIRPNARLLSTASEAEPVLIACGPQADAAQRSRLAELSGVSVWTATDAELAPRELLEFLAAGHAVNDVLVESGPTLAAAWHAMGMLDAFIHYQSPRVLADELPPTTLARLPHLSESHPIMLRLTGADPVAVGPDTRRELTIHPIVAAS